MQIETTPHFAIGQRALLLRTAAGNVLWDCLALLDDATIALVRALGGLEAIAISHPHYYTTCQDWARAFDCPVHLHAADREWVQRPDAAVRFWDGETLVVGDGVTLVRLGGHFPGGTVLHWTGGAGGRGGSAVGRYPAGDAGGRSGVGHVELPQSAAAVGGDGAADRGNDWRLAVCANLRGVLRARGNGRGRGGRGGFGRGYCALLDGVQRQLSK